MVSPLPSILRLSISESIMLKQSPQRPASPLLYRWTASSADSARTYKLSTLQLHPPHFRAASLLLLSLNTLSLPHLLDAPEEPLEELLLAA
jgi:hypothetical protein